MFHSIILKLFTEYILKFYIYIDCISKNALTRFLRKFCLMEKFSVRVMIVRFCNISHNFRVLGTKLKLHLFNGLGCFSRTTYIFCYVTHPTFSSVNTNINHLANEKMEHLRLECL